MIEYIGLALLFILVAYAIGGSFLSLCMDIDLDELIFKAAKRLGLI